MPTLNIDLTMSPVEREERWKQFRAEAPPLTENEAVGHLLTSIRTTSERMPDGDLKRAIEAFGGTLAKATIQEGEENG
jgi:hypothetical protein